MSMTNARAKLLHRISSPVEILYDVSLHWTLTLLLLCTGTVVMLTKVLNEPPLYQATAALVLNPNEVVLPELDPSTTSRRATARRESEVAFIQEQLALLQSDSVLDKWAEKIGDLEVLQQDLDPDPLKEPGQIQKLYKSVSSKLSDFLDDTVVQPLAADSEKLRHKAKAALKRRSFVLNLPRSNLVTIGVKGTRRTGLKEELGAWIEAYRDRIDEISAGTDQVFLKEQIEYWTGAEQKAKERLDAFRKANPDINVARQESQRDQVAGLNRVIEELKRDPGAPVVPLLRGRGAPLTERDAELEGLRRTKERMVAEQIELEAKFPKTNDKVKQGARKIANLDQRIRGLGAPQAKQEEGKPRNREEEIAGLQKELDAAVTEQAEIGDKMAELTTLTADHQSASLRLADYRNLMQGRLAQNNARKLVDMKVQDSPTVGVEPLAKPYYQVALGLAGGGLMGFMFSFGIEMFCQRIRLRKDLEDELGLKVIGVIPGE